MANGAEGKLLASRTRDLQQHIQITGSEGYLEIGLWSDNLRMRSNKGKAFQQLPYLDAYVSRRPPQDASFVLQLNNLVNAIRGEEKVLVDGFEGMAAVDVVARAYGTYASSQRIHAAEVAGAPDERRHFQINGWSALRSLFRTDSRDPVTILRRMQCARVTAYIPAYNVSEYLARTIEGLLSQTHPFDEILVIDDGSRDDSVENRFTLP